MTTRLIRPLSSKRHGDRFNAKLLVLNLNTGDKKMNTKTKKYTTLAAIVITFCLFSLGQSASTQSNCKKLKGTSVGVFDPATGILSGPITNAGMLNGTAEDVVNFNAGFVLTPDPNVVTYLSDQTITTVNGHLKSSNNVNAFNFVEGTFTEFGSINPDTSTGRFAGATGVIFFTGKTIGSLETGPYEAEITGEICFAQ
jgi:hypothetical protein